MAQKSNKPKVLEIDGDGLFATIEFTQENGERVSAIYCISGWINVSRWQPASIAPLFPISLAPIEGALRGDTYAGLPTGADLSPAFRSIA